MNLTARDKLSPNSSTWILFTSSFISISEEICTVRIKIQLCPFNKLLLSLIYVKLRLAREILVWNSCNSYNEFNENLTDVLVTPVHVWKDGWAWSPRKTFLFSFVKSA